MAPRLVQPANSGFADGFLSLWRSPVGLGMLAMTQLLPKRGGAEG